MIDILLTIFSFISISVFLMRIKQRGFFWLDKEGNELSFKDFMKRWKEGINGISPIQQTLTTLWSYPLIIMGILTGMIIMLLRKEWWLVLILTGSLPITLMGLVSTWQKYQQQKRIYHTMKKLKEEDEK